jgi:hypothetical protein
MYRARQVLAVSAWILTIAVLVQVFLAGMAVFGASSWQLHIDVGFVLPVLPMIMLILAWPARPGQPVVVLTVGLLALLVIQTFLPWLRDTAPLVSALHAPNALLIFGLAFMVARRATLLLRTERMVSVQEDAAAVEPAPTQSS